VSITSTTFDRFSNCGSIIRNSKIFLDKTYFDYAALVSHYTNSLDSNFFVRNQNEIPTINTYLKNHVISPLTCTTSASSPSNQCYSISMSTCIFSNFNYLKEVYYSNPLPVVNPSLGM
jgi:hypothetical protein